MEESRDIMIHGIPNVTDANATLREILDQYYERFGSIKWLRLGSNRGFHSTNYGFLRYQDETVHPEAVDFLNRVGIPHTRIWFELNRQTTQMNHFLQEAPASQRVQRQLEELERHEQQVQERGAELTRENNRLKAEIEVSAQYRIALENQLTNPN